MSLKRIPSDSDKLDIYLAYGTTNNFSNQKIYQKSYCFLHKEAAEKLYMSAEIALSLGYKLLIWDAYRPPEAQEKLWSIFPDATFITPPEKGSPHSRGVAVDLTLCDASTGQKLDMGTAFDDFTPQAFHTCTELSHTVLKNRLLLLGIMTRAGWDFYEKEWWHYQLFHAKSYPIIEDGTAGAYMMKEVG